MSGDVRQNARVRSVAVLLIAGAVACGASAGAPPAPGRVTGTITAVDRDGSGTIVAFTVQEAATAYEIRIDPSKDYRFDLEHLEEHRAGHLPVRVTLEDRDGSLYAVEILDA